MHNEDLFKRILAICDELERIDKEHPIDSSEAVNAEVSQLMLEGKRIYNELDPVIRVICRDWPDKLSEWEQLEEIFDSIEERNLNGGLTEPPPSTQDEETDAQTKKMGQGDKLPTDKLDPMDPEELRAHLEELAEWDRHMETYYSFGKTEPDDSDS